MKQHAMYQEATRGQGEAVTADSAVTSEDIQPRVIQQLPGTASELKEIPLVPSDSTAGIGNISRSAFAVV